MAAAQHSGVCSRQHRRAHANTHKRTLSAARIAAAQTKRILPTAAVTFHPRAWALAPRCAIAHACAVLHAAVPKNAAKAAPHHT